MKVGDTSHVAEFQDFCCGLSWFVFATKSADFFADFVADFLYVLYRIKFHCSDTNWFVTDLSQTLLHFHDLCLWLSQKVHDFMICHRLCPWFLLHVSATFPVGRFWWKSAYWNLGFITLSFTCLCTRLCIWYLDVPLTFARCAVHILFGVIVIIWFVCLTFICPSFFSFTFCVVFHLTLQQEPKMLFQIF